MCERDREITKRQDKRKITETKIEGENEIEKSEKNVENQAQLQISSSFIDWKTEEKAGDKEFLFPENSWFFFETRDLLLLLLLLLLLSCVVILFFLELVNFFVFFSFIPWVLGLKREIGWV